jgi:predicted transcriptional regulator
MKAKKKAVAKVTMPFTVRLDSAAKAALDKAAAAQGRPSANLAQWFIVEGLKAGGWLK